MIIQLPTGEAVNISEQQYFDMSDDEFAIFVWKARGYELQDPFHDSVISRRNVPVDIDEEYNGVVPLGHGAIEDLDIPE